MAVARKTKLVLRVALLITCVGASVATDASPAYAQTALGAAERPHALEAGRTLVKEGKYVEAVVLARQRLPEVEAAHGTESVQAADVLDVLVEALWRGGNARNPDARALAERAVAIKEKALGPAHPEVARSLSILANLFDETGDYAGARPLFERALAIREKALGPEHPDVASTLNSLAVLSYRHGDYSEARLLYERSLASRERVLGPEHSSVAVTLNNLAILFRQTGDYARARSLNERSLAIREKTLGPEHPDVAASLNNLANLSRKIGDYVGARSLYERSLAIKEKALGPEHPDVALGLNNLALLMTDTGDYAEARTMHERALAIREKALGPEHSDVAQSLNSLAFLFYDIADYARAKPFLERSLAIRERLLGSDHADVAQSLNDLANLFRQTGDYERSRTLFERALAIRERLLGSGHADVAQSLNDVANLFRRTGDYERARLLFERAIAIREKAFGPLHPGVAESVGDLAELLVDAGSPDAALGWALRAEDVARAHLRLTARTLAERQALAYASKGGSGLRVALSVAASGAKRRDQAWDALIRSRAVVLDEMAARHRGVVGAADPQVERLALDVVSTRQRLANLMVRGPADRPEIYRRLLDDTLREREQAERALGERAASFRREQERERIGLSEVAATLPRGSALVAFARYDRRHALAGVARGAGQGLSVGPESTSSYLAFILPSVGAKPALVALGAAADIDRLVVRWKEEAGEGQLASTRSQVAEGRYRLASQELRQKIWDPLLPHLENAKAVFVVPDGALNLVSLASLSVGESKYLVETGPSLHYLSAERDLVPERINGSRGGLLAVGGPAFDERTLFAALVPPAPGPAAARLAAMEPPVGIPTVFRGARSSCGDFDTMQFEALPSTVHETEALSSLWSSAGKARGGSPVVRLTGVEATETAVKKQAPGHRVLHLATHGFFLGERCPSAADGQRQPTKTDQPRIGGENPLLLSGLALAGANHRSAVGTGEDDGILTAEEIAALDLSGVEWAVLSACDTGVGEIRAGEGVFGLRRAFQVAGARTLIMSLWPQEDESARRWMEALYRARLEKRLSTSEAVRQASLERLRERRKRGQSTHPFFWGGFVAAGDWR